MKSLILTLLALIPLLASEQLIVVVADDFDTPSASLQRYEYISGRYKKTGETLTVNIGRNGLGWGIGEREIPHGADEPVKKEGDGKAPAGIFSLGEVFGYARRSQTAMPYLQATPDLICVDDSASSHYNKITPIHGGVVLGSFEWMKRDDTLYELGVTVNHNTQGIAQRGSCIFLHIQKGENSPTAGCTSMTKQELGTVIDWLDPNKSPLLVQIPRKYCSEVENDFNGVSCSN